MELKLNNKEYSQYLNQLSIGIYPDEPISFIIQSIIYDEEKGFFWVGFRKDKNNLVNDEFLFDADDSDDQKYFVKVHKPLVENEYSGYDIIMNLSEGDFHRNGFNNVVEILNRAMIEYSQFKSKQYQEIDAISSEIHWAQVNLEAKKWFVERDLDFTMVQSLIKSNGKLDTAKKDIYLPVKAKSENIKEASSKSKIHNKSFRRKHKGISERTKYRYQAVIKRYWTLDGKGLTNKEKYERLSVFKYNGKQYVPSTIRDIIEKKKYK